MSAPEKRGLGLTNSEWHEAAEAAAAIQAICEHMPFQSLPDQAVDSIVPGLAILASRIARVLSSKAP